MEIGLSFSISLKIGAAEMEFPLRCLHSPDLCLYLLESKCHDYSVGPK